MCFLTSEESRTAPTSCRAAWRTPSDYDRARHHNSRFVPVLSLAVTGVLAGCRSPTAIWEHVTDLTAANLRSRGLAAGQALPSETTIRRVRQDLDPADVDAHLRSRPCPQLASTPVNFRRRHRQERGAAVFFLREPDPVKTRNGKASQWIQIPPPGLSHLVD